MIGKPNLKRRDKVSSAREAALGGIEIQLPKADSIWKSRHVGKAPEAAGRSQTKPFWIYMTIENALRLQWPSRNAYWAVGMIAVSLGTRRSAGLAFSAKARSRCCS
jgi:hypothetical protein